MDDIYENIGEYNPDKKREVLIVFDYRICFAVPKNIRLNYENSKQERAPTNRIYSFIRY